MSSSNFSTVLVRNSIINDISDSIVYAVKSGASSSSYQQFSAVTSSPSQLSFNVQIPSESIVVDRNVLINATYNVTVTATGVASGVVVFKLGESDSLQAFPLNSSFNTLSCQINNSNVSINTKDVLPQLIKMMTLRDLQKYAGFTPTMPDGNFKNYADGDATTVNNPLSAYKKAGYDNELLPRGAHPITIVDIVHNINGGGTNKSLVSTHVNDTWVITLAIEMTEPLFLSPFIFSGNSDYNNAGFVGVNQMNIVANVDTSLARFFSSSSAIAWVPTLTSITNAKVLINFLSTQSSQIINPRNVIPYQDYPRYITTYNSAVTAGSFATIVSQNIQLNQIPDSFIICARKPMQTQGIKDTATFLPIRGVSINFNNSSGLLSSATAQDLWRISKTNGSQQSWNEYWGYAGNVLSNYYGDPAGGTTPGTTLATASVPTGGSLLVISPTDNLSLPDDLSSGSIGQFNLQINVTVLNNGSTSITPELVVICVNSGAFSTISGSSSIYTGLLSREIVSKTVQSPAQTTVSSSDYQRMVGGSLSNMVASAAKALPMVRQIAKGVVAATDGGAYSGGASCRSKGLDSLTY